MPRLIDCADEASIELPELVEALESGAFEPDDDESIASYGPMLARLGRNRRFLADLAIAELEQRCSGQVASNQYGAQVIMLHASAKFLIRANFWPSAADSVVVNSGSTPFFYDVPHDHNFSFLTVGYLGPGYWSDYYEYDYSEVVGHVGEQAGLRFVERSRLTPGKVMLYRRHMDVHAQGLPDSLSVSLNILGLTPANEFREQYRFDTARGEVAAVINPSGLANLVRLSAHFGGEEGQALVEEFAARHPSERIRFAAWQARAGVEANAAARLAVYERAAASSGRYVSAMAAREANRLQCLAAAS
jgi:hypothetical protein